MTGVFECNVCHVLYGKHVPECYVCHRGALTEIGTIAMTDQSNVAE